LASVVVEMRDCALGNEVVKDFGGMVCSMGRFSSATCDREGGGGTEQKAGFEASTEHHAIRAHAQEPCPNDQT
jgi:hypothetical protein